MFIIKMLGKIILIPIWIFIAMLHVIVSFAVSIIGFVKVLSGMILGLLLIGTIICYHDAIQAVFLIALIVIGYLLLFSGVAIEVLLETLRKNVGRLIME